jgi:DNA-binding XRE family transcriptional regulator
MSPPTEVVTRRAWESYAKRVERETRLRHGQSLTFTQITTHAGRMIVEIRPDALVVRTGWRRVMRAAAHGSLEPEAAATLGARIQAARRAAGWSRARLAAAIGLAPENLARLEDGRTQDPHVSTIQAIAETLHVSMDALCGVREKEEE